eukprot:2750166-Amphidinium_carterae.1
MHASLRKTSVHCVPMRGDSRKIICVATYEELQQACESKRVGFIAILPGDFVCHSIKLENYVSVTGVGDVTLQLSVGTAFMLPSSSPAQALQIVFGIVLVILADMKLLSVLSSPPT